MSAPPVDAPPLDAPPVDALCRRTPADPVTIRPLQRCDAAHAVDTVFAALSPRSRYLRFHSPVPRLVATVREQLIDIDGRRRAAVVAEVAGADGPVPIGIARVIGTGGETTADLSVAVADAWQRRGVGRRLLTALTELATDIGYTHLRGSVLPENVAMLTLATSLSPMTRRRFDGYTVELLIPIGAAAWTVTEEDVLADLLSRST
ncbi:GNAT family N-acetyltransferase [Pseudonocardia sp. GCM10023141]|uniref:GNAT family N-acetyltransferase n=1 Tax=Pseudonocardia sp. GCM10023141 TaxID=3252653 RepID=UPI003617EF46